MIPNIEITEQGIEAPTTQQVQAGLWIMMQQAFGPGLTEDLRTPQGQLVTSLTAAITDRDNAFVELANNFDPRYSFGVYQDALAELYFISRRGETASVVRLEFTGTESIEIPSGTVCIDADGVEWVTELTVTVGVNGRVMVDAVCRQLGRILAAPNTVSEIVSPPPGIDSVTNPTSAIPGSDSESREEFEDRRSASVAKNGKGMNASVFGEVSDLPGVLDCFVEDNPTDETVTVGVTDYPMIRNSLLVSVVGGNPMDIARAILIKGGTGCAFVGNTEIEYFDNENYPDNPPSYIVRFLRPDRPEVFIRVLVDNYQNLTAQEIGQIRQSIVDNINLRIGSEIFTSRLNCVTPETANIVSIEIARDEPLNWSTVARFGIDESPVINIESVTVEQA